MFTYLIRKRHFKTSNVGDNFEFPTEVEVTLYLQPLQPFGKALMGGRTAIKSGKVTEKANISYNANVGRFYVETEPPIIPLAVNIVDAYGHLVLNGNCMTLKGHRITDINEFYDFVETFYFAMPLLLNVEFADAPIVERIEGKVGRVPFRWEVAATQASVEFVTKEKQEQKVVSAWNRFPLVSLPQRRRLIGALHYFHVACRLMQVGNTPGEFLAEALLNFHKVLEVLYGPERNKVRDSLVELGFSKEEIERDFIPVMLLRDSIDVGHPMLAIFDRRQLDTLHMYADKVERAFRGLLNRLFNAIEAGSYEVTPYEVHKVDQKTQSLIETLRTNLEGSKPK